MGAVRFIKKILLGGVPPKDLRLSLISPQGGKCTVPRARDKAPDMINALQDAIIASGLPTREWINEALARYAEAASEAVSADPQNGYLLHHGVDVTDREKFALAVVEGQRATGMNLGFRHERETFAMRTVILGLEVANAGNMPATRIELELQISSRHRISTSPMTGFSGSIGTVFPIPPETVEAKIADLDLDALREIENRKWYSETRPQDSSWSDDHVMLVEEKRTGDDKPWRYRSESFDLRQGRSVRTKPLYVCFEYDPAHDLEISYQLSAENLPGITDGSLHVRVTDAP